MKQSVSADQQKGQTLTCVPLDRTWTWAVKLAAAGFVFTVTASLSWSISGIMERPVIYWLGTCIAATFRIGHTQVLGVFWDSGVRGKLSVCTSELQS